MRNTISVSVIAIAAVVTGCGGGGGTSSSTVPAYSIGGSLSGLTGSVILQDDGGDNLSLSSDGAFVFSRRLQINTLYDVTVLAQPAGQVCSVSNGSGTVTAAVTNIAVICSAGSSMSGEWMWRTGSDQAGAAGVYGTQGAAAANNSPGARRLPASWTDASGNFWLFGGYGADSSNNFGMLDDLWEYSLSSGEWTWEGGSNTEGTAALYRTQGTPGGDPGGREGASRWSDAAGNLWLFGGDSLSGQSSEEFNDLWKYDSASGQWTWVGGSNTPGNAGSYGTLGSASATNLPPARTDAITWTDGAGIFWLFGGAQLTASGSVSTVFDDLWNYNPTTGQWTWFGGLATPNAAGVYGTKGTAAAGNVPGSRMGGNAWVDKAGNVWLFGGLGLQNGATVEYNDLWKFNPSSGDWAWMGGSNSVNAAGVYGSQGAGAAANMPGARFGAMAWLDSSGKFWLFGGYGADVVGNQDELSDLWQFNPSAGIWTWISGYSYTGEDGVYGTQGTPGSNNIPGAREQAGSWLDSKDNLWLFGGVGVDGFGNLDALNDLWSFAPTP